MSRTRQKRGKGNGKGKKKSAEPLPPILCESQPVRKLRVLYEDSDDTDSSCDDEMMEAMNGKKKQVFYDIFFPLPIDTSPQIDSGKAKPSKTPKSAATSTPSSGPKYKGVRQRKWGKFASEIRDPIRRVRHWLGTYETAEEASEVYIAATMRIQTELEAAASAGRVPEAPIASDPDLSVPSLFQPSPSSASCQLDAGQFPPDMEAEIRNSVQELFNGNDDLFDDMDFGLEDDIFLVGNFIQDFIWFDDLPTWEQQQFDGDDFDFNFSPQ